MQDTQDGRNMTTELRYLSLFSGIGGFEIGIEQSLRNQIKPKEQPTERAIPNERASANAPDSNGYRGWTSATCIGYSEIDKYAIKVYERQFGKYESCDEHAHISEEPEQEERTQGGERPTNKHGVQLHDRNRTATLCNRCKGHKNYGDATTINAKGLPDFDLLVGGFPCQAFSIAGKRKGFDDTRGTLFFDIARILAEKRPRHLVLENVKGLLSHEQGKTFQTILGVLSDLGYRVEWQVLNSKDFGVPQNRERIYFVGHLGDECSGEVFPIINAHRQTTKPVQGHYTNTLTARYEAAQATGSYIIESELNAQIRRLTPTECARLQGFPDNWCSELSDTQAYKCFGNAVTVNTVQAVMEKLTQHIAEVEA